jgi:hypothetical protein
MTFKNAFLRCVPEGYLFKSGNGVDVLLKEYACSIWELLVLVEAKLTPVNSSEIKKAKTALVLIN